MIIDLLQQMEAGRDKQARFTEGLEASEAIMQDSPTKDPGPVKVEEAMLLSAVCGSVLGTCSLIVLPDVVVAGKLWKRTGSYAPGAGALPGGGMEPGGLG